MPPKKPNSNNKKLSKQELKAQKKEQKEKKKEDAKKLADERKRLAEEEAKRLEEEARLAWEAEQARLQAEDERISHERESLSSFFDRQLSTLASLEATRANQDDWRRFVEATNIPHAHNEGIMNNYFNALETSWDDNYDAMLSTIMNIYKVIINTEDLSMLEMQKGNMMNLVERFETYMKKLESLMQNHIDLTTAYLLNRSYEAYKQTNETTVFAMAGDWKIYLWINLVKNPRLRVLNEPTLAISITIPKAFTFANVAIRVYHQMSNPLMKSSNIYTAVEEECWRKDGITDVEYEKSSRIVKFQTIRARPHAIIQSRVKYYPYHSWILTPISDSKALFILESHGHIIKIEIGSGWVKLAETPFCECKHIVGQELDPIILLKKLSRCGLHLMPVDDDGQFVSACIKIVHWVYLYFCKDLAQ